MKECHGRAMFHSNISLPNTLPTVNERDSYIHNIQVTAL